LLSAIVVCLIAISEMEMSNLNKTMLLAMPPNCVDPDRTAPKQKGVRQDKGEVGIRTVEEEEEAEAQEISEISPLSTADLQKEMMQLQQHMTVLQAVLTNRNRRERVPKNPGRPDQSFVSRPETTDNRSPFRSPRPSWYEQVGIDSQHLRESSSTPLPESLGGLVSHPSDPRYASFVFLQPGHDPIYSAHGWSSETEEEMNIARALVELGQPPKGGTRQYNNLYFNN
jgi:hypothetical protein